MDPKPKRKPVTFVMPDPIDTALRCKAERDDTPLSRLVLRYVREGLKRDGALVAVPGGES
jgi:hypothetical protein